MSEKAVSNYGRHAVPSQSKNLEGCIAFTVASVSSSPHLSGNIEIECSPMVMKARREGEAAQRQFDYHNVFFVVSLSRKGLLHERLRKYVEDYFKQDTGHPTASQSGRYRMNPYTLCILAL